MTNEEKIEIIEDYFSEDDDDISNITQWYCDTFYIDTEAGRSYIAGTEEDCRKLAIQEIEDSFEELFDDERLLDLLDETGDYVDDSVLEVVSELYDFEDEDIESFDEFKYKTGLGFADLVDYGLSANDIYPYIDFHGLCSYIVDEDGVANTLAKYDGDEVHLGYGMYLYRCD